MVMVMMTRLWPDGDPITVIAGPDGTPQQFAWQGQWRRVATIANRWRVRSTWWSTEAWREYFKLTTDDGLLCTVYQNLQDAQWFCARLYD